MENRNIIIGAVIAIGLVAIIIFSMSNNSVQQKSTDDNKLVANAQMKVENPEELKMKVTEEAKGIKNKVKFGDISSSMGNNITTVTGTVENLTSDTITPYMNIYFYDKENKLVITSNAFADKVPASGSKSFSASLTGDYSSIRVEAELAKLE